MLVGVASAGTAELGASQDGARTMLVTSVGSSPCKRRRLGCESTDVTCARTCSTETVVDERLTLSGNGSNRSVWGKSVWKNREKLSQRDGCARNVSSMSGMLAAVTVLRTSWSTCSASDKKLSRFVTASAPETRTTEQRPQNVNRSCPLELGHTERWMERG